MQIASEKRYMVSHRTWVNQFFNIGNATNSFVLVFLAIFDQLLIQYFYSGLLGDRTNIDAAAREPLAEKTPTEAHQLISTMAENSQRFET